MFFQNNIFYIKTRIFLSPRKIKKSVPKHESTSLKQTENREQKSTKKQIKRSNRPISMSQLNTSLYLHLSPINLLV